MLHHPPTLYTGNRGQQRATTRLCASSRNRCCRQQTNSQVATPTQTQGLRRNASGKNTPRGCCALTDCGDVRIGAFTSGAGRRNTSQSSHSSGFSRVVHSFTSFKGVHFAGTVHICWLGLFPAGMCNFSVFAEVLSRRNVQFF